MFKILLPSESVIVQLKSETSEEQEILIWKISKTLGRTNYFLAELSILFLDPRIDLIHKMNGKNGPIISQRANLKIFYWFVLVKSSWTQQKLNVKEFLCRSPLSKLTFLEQLMKGRRSKFPLCSKYSFFIIIPNKSLNWVWIIKDAKFKFTKVAHHSWHFA